MPQFSLVPAAYHHRHRGDSSKDRSPSWYVFNDFLVSSVPEASIGMLYGKMLMPAILVYQKRDFGTIHIGYEALPKSLDRSFLAKDILLAPRKKPSLVQSRVVPLKPEEWQQQPAETGSPFLCAIDTEFVAVKQEDTEIHSDGSRSIVRPRRFALARVSVIRGSSGPLEGVPFIDDYIAVTESIFDYQTEFSGIRPGDLEPATSPYNLTTLKAAYTKLRILTDMGCIFVGHGLEKDFRIASK
jgi:PAB-dependent poly(A)-specific ribonuclease subunit 2